MKTSFHRVPTDDKIALQGLLYVPEVPTKKAYLHVHGMAGSFYGNRFLDDLAPGLADVGYAFFSMNNRGHDIIADFYSIDPDGKSRRIGNAYEKFTECVLDIKAGIDFLERAGYEEIVLGGHSLGANKAAYYITETKDSRVKKLVLMSTPDMAGLAEAENDHHAETLKQAEELIARGKGEDLMPEVFFGEYYMCPRTYKELNSRDYPVDIFSTYDPEKPSRLSEIAIPVLALIGDHNEAAIMDSADVLEIIKKKATNASRFDTMIIEGANHGYYGKGKEMTEKVVSWLTQY